MFDNQEHIKTLRTRFFFEGEGNVSNLSVYVYEPIFFRLKLWPLPPHLIRTLYGGHFKKNLISLSRKI